MGASGNPNATRLSALSERKKALEDTLQKYNLELRKLCIKEAELTGVIPIEYPLEPGEKPPVFQKTQYLLNNLNNGDESISEMELELQVLAKMADAAQGLANDHNMGKTVRRHHRSEYEAIKKRYEALLEKIQFSEDSYPVAARQTASTSNKTGKSQPKQKKKPRPSDNTATVSSNSVGSLIMASSEPSSFTKESPQRHSSRSLASDKNLRDSIPNLVSVSAQTQGADSSDANVGNTPSTGRSLQQPLADTELAVSISPAPCTGMNGGAHARSRTFDDVAHPTYPDKHYSADRFAQVHIGIQSNAGRRVPYAPRIVYEENQRQLDSLLCRQQAMRQAHAQTLDRRHDGGDGGGGAHPRPEHHSMYNINSSFPRQQQAQQMYDDSAALMALQSHSTAVRPHSVLVARPPHLHHHQQQQLQPHQLYADSQQPVLVQRQQRLFWRAGADSPPHQQHQQHLDMSPSSSTMADNSSSPPISTTPLRYGSLDRRRERPQRTLHAPVPAQAQNHDVQRRKKMAQNKGGGSRGTPSGIKEHERQQELHLQSHHQQLQRTQSLGSVGVGQQHAGHVGVGETSIYDTDVDIDLDLAGGQEMEEEDIQSSCGSEQSIKYQQMRRRRRSKEKNWYESSLDATAPPLQQTINGVTTDNVSTTHSSAQSIIAPEDKYGDVSVSVRRDFRQRAATISAANAASIAITSSSASAVRPLSTSTAASVTANQHYNNFRERLIVQHRPPPKQHIQQPPIQPRAHQQQQGQLFMQPSPQLVTAAVAVPPPAPLAEAPAHLLEIPAESWPSPALGERAQHHAIYTSPIPKAGTTVLQVGQCKPYQEETKPFEMSDYYKYSTKHNKPSPVKQQPSTPNMEFQHSSLISRTNYVSPGSSLMAAQRAIHFSPTSPSKGQQGGSSASSRIILATPISNSPRRSMNLSFDLTPAQNVAENFATEMNQWYNNNNVNNNMHVADVVGAPIISNSSPRKGNPTTTATLV